METVSKKRRQHKRHRVRECQVSFKAKGMSSFINFKSPTQFPVSDVSQEGACFVADSSFEQGDKLKLILDIPAFVKPLKIDAEVMWCQKMEGYEKYFRVGVHFIRVSKDDNLKLSRLNHDSMLHNVRREVK